MNLWVYLGWGLVSFVIIMMFIFVAVGIFVCIDQYFDEKRGDNNEDNTSGR